MPSMASKRRPAKKPSAADETPLSARKNEVAEQEAKLRAQMEKYKKLIEDAPRLAKERERRLQEQFVIRKSRTEADGRSRAALRDRRYELNAGAPAKLKRLRAERNRGRLMFFILLLVFGGLVAWLYFNVLPH